MHKKDGAAEKIDQNLNLKDSNEGATQIARFLTEKKEEDPSRSYDMKGSCESRSSLEPSMLTTSTNVQDPAVQFEVGIKDTSSSVLSVYRCWICSDEFLDKLSIIQHLKKLHAGRPELQGIECRMKVPICLTCGVSGGCEHRRPRTGPRKLTDEESESSGDEECHSDSHPWCCAICYHRFKTFTALRKHRTKRHPEEKSYQCSFCPSAFINQSHLVAHTRIHTGSRPHKCSVCGNRFSRRSDLLRHQRTHTGEKPFKCEHCDRSFTQKASLEKHARVHAKHMGCLACEQCGLLFKTSSELNMHSKSAHKDRVWKCQTCGKAFDAQRYLLLHEKSHKDTKQFPCNFCGKKFSLHVLVTKHEDKIHNNRQDIKCEECGRVFKRRENLARHKRTHTGLKEFKCPVCGLGFSEAGSVKRHMMSKHELARPHECVLCFKSFTRKFLLNKHLAKYHPQGKASNSEPEAEVEETLGF